MSDNQDKEQVQDEEGAQEEQQDQSQSYDQKINYEPTAEESEEEEEEDGQLGTLFVDKEDRQRLEKMSELEREMIIAQRAEEQDNQRLLQKTSEEEKGPDLRASTRLTAQRSRSSAMSELREKRAARERKIADEEDDDVVLSDEGNEQSTYGSDDDFIDDDDDLEEDFGKPKKSSQKRTRDDADQVRSSKRRHIPEDVGTTGFEGATLDDILAIQITRDVVEQWVNEPYFEETLPNCLVKISADRRQDPRTHYEETIYLVASVVEVIEGDTFYKFGKIRTSKQVVVRDENEEKQFQLDYISNRAITKIEFDAWTAKLETAGEDPVTKSMVEAVKEKIHKANTYTYTAEDVKQLVEQRRKKGSVVINPVMEKVRLQRLLDYNRENGNQEEVERIEAELQLIEERILQDAKQQKPSAYDKINQRNKQVSMKRAHQSRPMKQTSTRALAASKETTKKLTPEEIAKRRQKFDPVKLLKEIDWSVDLSILDSDRAKMTMAKRLLGTRFKLTEDKLSVPLIKDRNNVLTIADYKRKQGLS
eukprot:TRINITY_DN40049_c0_g2_i1.p1 TRINITY_DN40049_c0_g2~~TRINITY_DN40049_c0_g2_i1.p1  ORF type:complete len:547 (-),score=67.25 TRINITY_DN40049_c0_g2_i1:566-2167(-)